MNCLESLEIPVGVTSVVGSGGKTTLLRVLAERISRMGGTVILATTTHFLPFEGIPLVTSDDEGAVREALGRGGVVCVGAPMVAGRGGGSRAACKLGPSPIGIDRLARLASHVVVEADGSRRLPLKAHAAHEPVVPADSARTVLVVGASGLGEPVRDVVHRPELFCERAGCAPDDVATAERVARALGNEVAGGILSPDAVVVNQADLCPTQATDLAHRIERVSGDVSGDRHFDTFVGSIRSDDLRRCVRGQAL